MIRKRKFFPVPAGIREIPGEKVAHMNASPFFHPEASGKFACLIIVHMLRNADGRRDQRVYEQKVSLLKEREALSGYIPVCVGGKPDAQISSCQKKPIGLGGGMADREEHDLQAAKPERYEWFYRVCGKRKKGKNSAAVLNNARSAVGVRNILDPVKFSKSHEMVIMTMGPDHGIDSGAAGPEKLLPEIRRRIDEEGVFPVLDED